MDKRVEKLVEALQDIVTMDQLNNEAVQLLRLVPDGYIPLPHQVGGHRLIDGKPGMFHDQQTHKHTHNPSQPYTHSYPSLFSI